LFVVKIFCEKEIKKTSATQQKTAMSSLDINDKAFMSNCLIRIALVPVGNIPPSTFKKFASMIKRSETIQLQNLTRFQEDNMKSTCAALEYFLNGFFFSLTIIQDQLKRMIGNTAR